MEIESISDLLNCLYKILYLEKDALNSASIHLDSDCCLLVAMVSHLMYLVELHAYHILMRDKTQVVDKCWYERRAGSKPDKRRTVLFFHVSWLRETGS